MAAELTGTFHAAKHNLSYEMWIAQQKWIEVFSAIPKWLKVYPVEKVNQKHFVKNVLAPYSVYKHIDYHKQNDIYKSIATDDSDKGSMKCFPLVLRYYHYVPGIQYCWLDFDEDCHEKVSRNHYQYSQ